MPVVLNTDCWTLIFKHHLHGDFQTLSRLLQVSRHFLTITAPLLYNQLDHPSNAKQISEWSSKKRNHVATLLFTSSGYFTQSVSGQPGCLSNHTTDTILALFNLKYPKTRLPYFKTPLSVNYFGLLKKMPHGVVEEVWEKCLKVLKDEQDGNHLHHFKDDGYYGGIMLFPGQDTNQEMMMMMHDSVIALDLIHVFQPHTKIMTRLKITSLKEVEYWLIHIQDLEHLSKLDVGPRVPPFDNETKIKMKEFVILHKTIFPNRLQEISTRTEVELVGDLNRLLQPIRLRMHIHHDLERQLSLGIRDLVEEGVCKNLKQVQFVDQNSTWHLNLLKGFLKNCRQVTKIEVNSWERSRAIWPPDLFEWAKEELEERKDVLERTTPYRQLHHHPYHHQQQELVTSSLVKLESFTGHHIPASVVAPILDGFRYSIQNLDFRCLNYRQGKARSVVFGPDWSWPLSRLTVLKLRQCQLEFRKLELCPVLEELVLIKVTSIYKDKTVPELVPTEGPIIQSVIRNEGETSNNSNDNDQHTSSSSNPLTNTHWRAMKSLRILSLDGGDSIFYLDLDSIGGLGENLQDLFLDHSQGIGITNLLRLIPSSTWYFPRLRRLMFGNSSRASKIWQSHLLRAAPNLEQYSFYQEGFKFQEKNNSWWCETPKESLERLKSLENTTTVGGGDHGSDNVHQDEHENKIDDQSRGNNNGGGDDQDISGASKVWNCQQTKLRSLSVGGRWMVRELYLFTDLMKDGTLSSLYLLKLPTLANGLTPVGFPHLCHLDLTELRVDVGVYYWDLVKVVMKKVGMEYITISSRMVKLDVVKKELEPVSDYSVPMRWSLDTCGQVGEHWRLFGTKSQGGKSCLLVIVSERDPILYFRLK